jgi:hypothetical protein
MNPSGIRMRLLPRRKRRPPFVQITLFYADDTREMTATPLSLVPVEIEFNGWDGNFRVWQSRMGEVVEGGKRFSRICFAVVFPDGRVAQDVNVMRMRSLLIRFTTNGIEVRFE